MGDIFQIVRPPVPKYCPRDTSMKKIGMPAHITVSKYGIKNAPEMELKTSLNIRQIGTHILIKICEKLN